MSKEDMQLVQLVWHIKVFLHRPE